MNLKEQLESGLKDAMRANDDVKRRTLRMALSNIKMAEIDQRKPLDEHSILLILQNEIKSRNEAIQEARKANRSDLEQAAMAEISAIEAYFPKQLTDSELQDVVKSVMMELNASSPSDMGRIIKITAERTQFRATRDRIYQIVRAVLQV